MLGRVVPWLSGLVAVLCVGLLAVAHLPGGRSLLIAVSGIRPGQDAIGHFWVLGCLGVALTLLVATAPGLVRRQVAPWWGLVGAAVLAIVDEGTQLLEPGRAATWTDLGAGLLGILLLGGASAGVVVLLRRSG